ncbi:MAG: bifunctional diaminohydroxyphosphoribosylaminopyrimidine deaminase/5-amino-6-(5-phosphoribosylamino)uracil reductase RibD [Sulfurimonas sp.]|uniref:bifunctional diaminohydroxyphosphoribosylaminopyrimidine deaminase/5-amino-6-(5-phosphoribosylamino)uracil reductase RibD n=1 Tax=Sulfurimonas sp. TaxID=2022749 RepID=UPI0025DDE400|nr:bifunctional diaminohydroxyphosphoribosylaminopyrimidine deaminase/5-amino-6-(5-phosphoribosylamino)uracil reductase RibD [Sulfurimonas sp.]MCK9490800.1 bifunctional diaminohydroxyphosphoribosylaminopyrimidine deaminase/5-amino-6-(5-phosphoribosylamino)uracil reductase RibD [Sulfurimonas sp.]
MLIDDNFFMSLAIDEAWKYQGLTYPNPAVGCVAVGANKEILAIEAHKCAGMPHAEVLALRSAYFKLTNDAKILDLVDSSEIHNYLLLNNNNCFKNISLYSTLEPCSHIGKTPSCASLISSLGIKEVFIGVADANVIASAGASIMLKSGVDVKYTSLQKRAQDLILPFKRFNKDQFIFFKWAQRLNATTDCGTISSQSSRVKVHAMRDVCDLLIIGGNTVREDRPTLDSRLVQGKAPDVLILSKSTNFDKNIPLFGVPSREVYVEDNLSRIKNYKNIMIEGSFAMFELTKDIVDYHLCFLAPTMGGKNGFEEAKTSFEILYTNQEDKDIILWMKREI